MALTDYLAVAANREYGDFVRLKAGRYITQIAQQTLSGLPVAFSGGYAGTDDESLDAENPYSEIDFDDYPASAPFNPLKISPAVGQKVSFERIRFTNARSAAIAKNGAGTLVLSDCIVVSNGWRNSADGSGSSRTGGRGIHAEGGAFYATNCVIAYNGPYRTQTSSPSPDSGCRVRWPNARRETARTAIPSLTAARRNAARTVNSSPSRTAS